MKTFAFERWCDRLQLPIATRDFLLRLRSSPQVRRVQGVEKKRPRGKISTYPDNPEVRDAYEKELRRLTLRPVILDEAQHLRTQQEQARRYGVG